MDMGTIPVRFCFHPEDVEERAIAAFLAFAIGDALGATAEFLTPGEVASEYGVLEDICGGGWLRLPAGDVTDDTEMSVCIGHSILAVGFSPNDIAERFAAWLRTRPRDVGATCRRGIRRYVTEGELFAAPNEMDGGNGAVMRMTPIALATLGDSDSLVRWSIEQAHITHHHALSDASCLVFGQLMQMALVGHSKQRLLALVRSFVARYSVFAFEERKVHSSAYVVDTMRTVFHAFFSTKSLEECVVTAVNYGGDADTVGAIAGALAGAYYGLAEIPKRWLRKLNAKVASEVGQLAVGLARQCPLLQGQRQYIARELLSFARPADPLSGQRLILG